MYENGVAGLLGIVVQITVFIVVALFAARRHGLFRGLVYGGITAVYGYALVIAFLALLGIPWEAANGVLAIGLAGAVVFKSTRLLVAVELPIVFKAVKRGWAAVAIILAVLIFVVVVAALEAEPSIDGQLYHGPALANLIQSGSLWGWAAPNQYIYYTDLTVAGGVNFATFAGDARFDNALQIPHLLLLIIVIAWALGRRFSSAFARVSLATLIVVAPVIWLQSRILYVDLAYGTAVAAVILLVVIIREFRMIDVIVTGIALAAVFATKPSGILTGIILLIALVAAVVIRRRGSGLKMATIRLLVVGIVPVLVLGTSFYIRNFVQFANPVYPISAKFGPVVFPGIIDVSIFASGERGSGFVDPARWISYARSIASGMVRGVSKLDYDPRSGGYGHIPLAVVVIVLALLVFQVVQRFRARGPRPHPVAHWRAQIVIIVLAAAILLVQPSTFDTRYVIGPTVVLLTALLLTEVFPISNTVQIVAGVLALVIAGGQVLWTEQTMYPGIKTFVDVMHGPAEWQPNTPAHPGSKGLQVAWLPSGLCVSIALQTAGGVTAAGMTERSYLGTLPYSLYGDNLCNRVNPVTLDGSADNTAAIDGAEYLVLYKNNVNTWEAQYPMLAKCLAPVYDIKGSDTYPQEDLVLRNTCV